MARQPEVELAEAAASALADVSDHARHGEIPSRKVGTQRRLKVVDVLLYRDVDQARHGEIKSIVACHHESDDPSPSSGR